MKLIAILTFLFISSAQADNVFTVEPTDSSALWIQLIKFNFETNCPSSDITLDINENDIIAVPPIFDNDHTVVVSEPTIDENGNTIPAVHSTNNRVIVKKPSQFILSTETNTSDCGGPTRVIPMVSTFYKRFEVEPNNPTTFTLTGDYDAIEVISIRDDLYEMPAVTVN